MTLVIRSETHLFVFFVNVTQELEKKVRENIITLNVFWQILGVMFIYIGLQQCNIFRCSYTLYRSVTSFQPPSIKRDSRLKLYIIIVNRKLRYAHTQYDLQRLVRHTYVHPLHSIVVFTLWMN